MLFVDSCLQAMRELFTVQRGTVLAKGVGGIEEAYILDYLNIQGRVNELLYIVHR